MSKRVIRNIICGTWMIASSMIVCVLSACDRPGRLAPANATEPKAPADVASANAPAPVSPYAPAAPVIPVAQVDAIWRAFKTDMAKGSSTCITIVRGLDPAALAAVLYTFDGQGALTTDNPETDAIIQAAAAQDEDLRRSLRDVVVVVGGRESFAFFPWRPIDAVLKDFQKNHSAAEYAQALDRLERLFAGVTASAVRENARYPFEHFIFARGYVLKQLTLLGHAAEPYAAAERLKAVNSAYRDAVRDGTLPASNP